MVFSRIFGADPQLRVFRLNVVALLAAIFYLLPLDLFGIDIRQRAFSTCLWTVLVASFSTIAANFGMPPNPMKAGMQACAPWLLRASNSNDFHFIFFCLMFLTSDPMMLVAVILGRRSLFVVGAYASKNYAESGWWTRVAGYWAQLKASEASILQYATLMEQMLGFWLIIEIFLPTRKLLTTFLYWQFLRMRYTSERAGAQHKVCWNILRQRADPVFKALPFLEKVTSYMKNWMEQGAMVKKAPQ